MGLLKFILSVMGSIIRGIFENNSGHGLAYEDAPISYLRQEDYTINGVLREGLHEKWNLIMKSMIFHEMDTRLILWPIIEQRMDRFEASQKFNNCEINHLLVKFPGWTEMDIFEGHDLFQAFEVDGDGLIEIAEMSVGLDNLGDTTVMKDRIPELCEGDEDATGSIDFEEFLQLLYTQQVIKRNMTSLSKTFHNVNEDVKFIRWMSSVQQIRCGFL